MSLDDLLEEGDHYLTGKYKPGTQFKEGDVRSTHDAKKTQEKLEEVQRISETEVPKGVDMAQWALAWCLQHDAVACVIPGCKDVKQVESNAAGADRARKDHPLIRPAPENLPGSVASAFSGQ